MQKLIGFILLLILIGCREKYFPPVNDASRNLLVVEGVINSGNGSTNIRLSRTMRLIDTATIKPELRATVTIQGKDNSNFVLSDKGSGLYSADQLPIDYAQQYRVHIKTADGKQYTSDYVEVKRTPLIDSISWERNSSGVEIHVNAHDVLAKTRYYRWEYEETWEIHSTVTPHYDFRNNRVVEIDPFAENIYYCWKSDVGTRLLLGSTAALSSDVVRKQPLVFIPQATEKLHVRYSILVRQYALTGSAYNFFKLMKKNTEELGSVFGPLPTELRGNIRNTTDPNEIVIGYITASSIEEKRIFIDHTQVPDWKFIYPCENVSVENNPDSIAYYFPTYRPYQAERTPTGSIAAYLGISPRCADCRLRNGVNVKPSFW